MPEKKRLGKIQIKETIDFHVILIIITLSEQTYRI